MVWKRMWLRDKRVWVEHKNNGQLKIVDSKVAVKYSEEGKTYFALPQNLSIEKSALGTPQPSQSGQPSHLKQPSPSSQTLADAKSHPTPAAIIAYTDGACSGNPGPAGAGAVICYPSHQEELYEFLGNATNNIAELTAILRALERIDERAATEIFTDSKYAIGVLTQGWKAKANSELIQRIKQRLAAFSSVKLRYVAGHSGIVLNERADELATEAIRTQKTSGWQTNIRHGQE